MTASDIVDRLAQHRTLGSAPREELAWLAAHGALRRAEVGDVLSRRTEPIDHLMIVLSGHFAIHVDRGLGPHKVMEWGGGDVTGFLPYSRMTTPPGEAVMDEAGDLFVVHRDHFPEMIRECPWVTAELVHVMLDRARRFTSSDLQDEKMMSLGKLAAGLAHELNNPASAAVRSARLLREGISPLEHASRELGAARLTDAQMSIIEGARKSCDAGLPSALSTMERADREEEIVAWLEKHGADPDTAGTLVDMSVTLEDLEALASALERRPEGLRYPSAEGLRYPSESTLATAIRWMAADCSTHLLAREVEQAAARMHDLVAAVKRFTYMDRVAAPEPINLATSLGDAVTLLLHKARRKSVALTVDVEPNLPRAHAIGGDLGQVWTNLIDNALDAAPESGRVTVTAARHREFVIVRVVDDGRGVPEEFRERIFDPFFTTKPVGQGTGLGLDIALRLVRRNGGDMEVESRPGRTEFRVTLPADSSGSSSSSQSGDRSRG